MVDCEEYVVDLIIEIVKQCILEMEGWMDGLSIVCRARNWFLTGFGGSKLDGGERSVWFLLKVVQLLLLVTRGVASV